MINYIAGGFEQILTVDASVHTLAPTLVSPVDGQFSGQKCEKIIFTVETASIMLTWDGTRPSAVFYVGTVYIPDKPNLFVMEGHANINRLQFCRTTSTNAVVNIQYLFLA